MDPSPVPAHSIRETPASSPAPPTAPELPQREVPLLLPRPAQWTAGAILAALLLWIGLQNIVRWAESFQSPALPKLQLDLNQATDAQVQQLPGVGPALAKRLVDYRDKHGPYKSLNDLRRVPGIGPAALERLRPHTFVADGSPSPTVARVSMYPPADKPKKQTEWEGPLLDLNQATTKDLEKLPGIGPKLADRIVDFRKGKRFETVDDLRKVSGIGPKILEKIRPYVEVSSTSPGEGK